MPFYFRVKMENQDENSDHLENEVSREQPPSSYEDELKRNEELKQAYREQKERIRQLKVSSYFTSYQMQK